MIDLKGKVAVVFGLANKRSIAWAIAQKLSEAGASLHRNVDALEVGNTALFLSSDLASGITGEITFVDCGYNVVGL
jgi:enoyl-[acyl-carrier protein] reductase I